MSQNKKAELEQKKGAAEEPSALNNKKSWVSRHSNAIAALTAIGSLITTIVLAIFAYHSLTEVKQQRNLAFKQFVVAHAPSVRLGVGPGFKFNDDGGLMTWMAVNEGGPVYDVELKSILMCCRLSNLQNLDTSNLLVRTSKIHRLHRNEKLKVMIEVRNSESLRWVKSILDKEEYGLFLYVRAKYTIPAELSLEGVAKQDAVFRVSGWDPFSKSFEYVVPRTRDIILQLIEERGYLSQERQG